MNGFRTVSIALFASITMAGLPISATAEMSTEPYVNLTLVLTGESTFDVNLEVSQSGNRGLAGFGLSLTGGIIDLQHELPSGIVLDSGLESKGSIGFSVDRDIQSNSDNSIWNLHAFQPVFGAAASIFGVGQVEGSLQTNIGATDSLFVNDGHDAFNATLRIASGTFSGTVPKLNWDPAATVFNLYTTDSTQGNTKEISLNLSGHRDQILPSPPAAEVNQATLFEPVGVGHVLPPEPIEVSSEIPPVSDGVSQVTPTKPVGEDNVFPPERTEADQETPLIEVSQEILPETFDVTPVSFIEKRSWTLIDQANHLSEIYDRIALRTSTQLTPLWFSTEISASIRTTPLMFSASLPAWNRGHVDADETSLNLTSNHVQILSPEPASVTLLGMGWLLSFRRRQGA